MSNDICIVHIETLAKFKDALPNPAENREREIYLKYKEKDSESSHRNPDYPRMTDVSARFRCMWVQDSWKWVYIGEIIL